LALGRGGCPDPFQLAYTFIAVMPTNKKLEAIAPEAAGSAARTMIETWGRLHAVRTSLGIVATLAYLWTLA
jgi:Anthrone oxygenase